MKDRIEVGVRELKASIKRMKELFEWQKLKGQEKENDMPPSFRLGDHLDRDMKLEEGVFFKTALDIRYPSGQPVFSVRTV